MVDREAVRRELATRFGKEEAASKDLKLQVGTPIGAVHENEVAQEWQVAAVIYGRGCVWARERRRVSTRRGNWV